MYILQTSAHVIYWNKFYILTRMVNEGKVNFKNLAQKVKWAKGNFFHNTDVGKYFQKVHVYFKLEWKCTKVKYGKHINEYFWKIITNLVRRYIFTHVFCISKCFFNSDPKYRYGWSENASILLAWYGQTLKKNFLNRNSDPIISIITHFQQH